MRTAYKLILPALTLALLAGCANRPRQPVAKAPVQTAPEWREVTPEREEEYKPYLRTGTSTILGQAFMNQRGGGTVRAAGSLVTLDPATTIGSEWWTKTSRTDAAYQDMQPPSVGFAKARRETVADADGRFKFSQIPAGRYYLRTEITWQSGGYSLQGGLVGQYVEIRDGEVKEIIMNRLSNG
ncbi:hypothetical protein [Parachitinimonas caeni]|uniref:Carboxypeptidase regulatory-like domain-containing protein n=1 Tax=Parachitinimonas caeni TaxID=3031301 RepID=A0ABT7DYK3_9NEIS|nr:hypothetical protein [Parachitinimonas caeni]MDK2124133.1 hypothetical protein [Parachitinimonas caeni]